MSRTHIGIVILFVMVCVIYLPSTGHGVSYQTVLKTGDTARFSVTGPYAENVTRTELQILSVVGSRLTANFTDTYLDGSQRDDTFYLDIATGERNSTVPGASFVFAVGTNLSPNDPIYTSSPYTIARQETRDCGGQSRETVFGTYVSDLLSIQSYWDRSTGLLCLFMMNDPGTSAPEDLRLTMVGTSIWTPGSLFVSDLFFVAPAIIAVALLIGVVLVLRRRSRSIRKSSS